MDGGKGMLEEEGVPGMGEGMVPEHVRQEGPRGDLALPVAKDGCRTHNQH